ncbi:MAG: alpha/beta hydrolase [Blautia sp.]|nr:alpha/beta hydrolase [Blautia sp.]
MQDSGEVLVKEIEKGYLFDGPGDENAIIFYPGGLVDYRAYAPLMQQIAGTGIDCFLVRMNYNLAFFGINKAQELQIDYSYRNWYMMGHSLGGVAAASYAAGHLEELTGIIFLASYPTKSLQADGFRALSVYGSNDGLVDRGAIEESREKMPEDYREVCIEGGSHAQFGNYGSQKKDGVPTINASEVQRQTIDAIRDCILR